MAIGDDLRKDLMQTAGWGWRPCEPARILVDLVGIEPTTSSMPWNYKRRILLTAKALIVGRVGKNY
jgi:hypothetical protein